MEEDVETSPFPSLSTFILSTSSISIKLPNLHRHSLNHLFISIQPTFISHNRQRQFIHIIFFPQRHTHSHLNEWKNLWKQLRLTSYQIHHTSRQQLLIIEPITHHNRCIMTANGTSITIIIIKSIGCICRSKWRGTVYAGVCLRNYEGWTMIEIYVILGLYAMLQGYINRGVCCNQFMQL